MPRLVTLGGLSVENGTVINGVANPRSRLAILAVIAVSGNRGIRREKLAAMFWPESDEERARNALRQALFILKRDIGAGDITLGGVDLRLNTEVVTSDVGDFDEAVRSGRLEDANTFYRGPFLDGVYLRESPEFERWADEQRTLLSAQYGRVLEGAAASATERGDAREGARWWARRAAHDPLSGRVARSFMEALAAAGDREEAIRHAATHAQLVRQELDAEPDPEVIALASRFREAVPAASAAVRLGAPGPSAGGSAPNDAAPATSVMVTGRGSSPDRTWRRSTGVWVALGLVGAAGMVVAADARKQRDVASARSANHSLVVAPFLVGMADTSLRFLAEGMVDLLTTRLAGDAVSGLVSPTAALAAFKSEAGRSPFRLSDARAVARSFGWDQVLSGAVVGSRSHIEISATISSTDHLSPLSEALVSGPVDSLLSMVDRLAATMLSQLNGEWAGRLPSLASASLPAVKAYLAGQSAYRHGRYNEASTQFRDALQLDSSFALAGLRLALASGWAGRPAAELDWGLTRAWVARDRLVARDRAFLEAFGTGRIPALRATIEIGRQRWERALSAVPDWPEVWFEYADNLFHENHGLDERAARLMPASALRRALELDSMFAPAIPHLLQLETLAGDTSAVRRLGTRFLSRDSLSGTAEYVRWRMALALRDAAALRKLRSRMSALPRTTLRWMVLSSNFDGVGIEDAQPAVDALLASASSAEERRDALRLLRDVALNHGRPRAALAVLDEITSSGEPAREADRLQVLDALYGPGDPAAARASAARLALVARAPLPETREDRVVRYKDLCVLSQWRLAQKDTSGVAAAMTELRGAADPVGLLPEWARGESALCAALLESLLAVATMRSVPARLALLDSVAQSSSPGDLLTYYPIARAQMSAAIGDTASALRAIRKRFYFAFHTPFMASVLRLEGTYAAAMGHHEAALRCFQRYLALRSRADRELAAEVADVRARMQQLRAK